MEYVVYRRFKAEGIDGAFNLRYGTTVTERDGFLFAADGRKICAATSETDGSISDQTRRRAHIVKRCSTASITITASTRARRTSNRRNGRGRKICIGKPPPYDEHAGTRGVL